MGRVEAAAGPDLTFAACFAVRKRSPSQQQPGSVGLALPSSCRYTSPPMRWSSREFAGVVAGFVLLTSLLTYPLVFHLGTLVYRPGNGDGQFSIWIVTWVAQALTHDPLHLADANIFYPH